MPLCVCIAYVLQGMRSSLDNPHLPTQSDGSNRQLLRICTASLTFRQPSVISSIFSILSLSFQHDAVKMLPEEIFSGTHNPFLIKKTTATIWPYSKHRNHFCFNFSLMMIKGLKQAGHKSKFSPLNIFQRVSVDLISVVFKFYDCPDVWL